MVMVDSFLTGRPDADASKLVRRPGDLLAVAAAVAR